MNARKPVAQSSAKSRLVHVLALPWLLAAHMVVAAEGEAPPSPALTTPLPTQLAQAGEGRVAATQSDGLWQRTGFRTAAAP